MINACRPLAICWSMKLYARSRSSSVSRWVSSGVRPGGISSITVRSRSAWRVRASVRGMGVAVITSRCGLAPLPRSRPRCATPKRCCSSMIASVRLAKSTSGWIRACVPITMETVPAASRASVSARSDGGVAPVNRRMAISCRGMSAASSPVTARKCCSARMLVGAISAACPPFATTISIARTATSVLPDPTSPCSRRFMGTARARSARISCTARSWAAVSGKGRLASTPASQPSVTGWGTPGSFCQARRRISMATCSRNSSSKANRSRA